MGKVKYKEDEDLEGGIAILGIGAALAGLFLWLRSRRAQAALTPMQFRQTQVKPNRSPARKVEPGPRGQGQRQPAATSLPRRDPTSRPDKDYTGPAFGFVF